MTHDERDLPEPAHEGAGPARDPAAVPDRAAAPDPAAAPGVAGPSLPDPPPAASPATEPLGPTARSRREPVLDLLRGAALLGITLVNIQLMSGPAVFALFIGEPQPDAGPGSGFIRGATDLLATGKFVSSFSILFGLGAAMIALRAVAAGARPRRLLARRYGLLVLFGLVHMVLLFPGDILFIYGVTGFILLAFIRVRARTALVWSVLLLAGSTVALAALSAAQVALDVTPDPAFAATVANGKAAAVEAYAAGSVPGIIAANAFQAFFIQFDQLFALPWFLSLFLLGFAATRAGLVADLRGHRQLLVRLLQVCLPLGLVLNLPQLIAPPTGMAGGDLTVTTAVLGAIAYTLGAPVLAVGYLAALAVFGLDHGVEGAVRRRVAALGSIALSGYLAQSVLAMAVFGGLRLYGQVGALGELAVVAGIWLVLLLVAPLWTARYRFGPAEWLWRSLTYGRRQPLRRAPAG